jgi:hypothetical protein
LRTEEKKLTRLHLNDVQKFFELDYDDLPIKNDFTKKEYKLINITDWICDLYIIIFT